MPLNEDDKITFPIWDLKNTQNYGKNKKRGFRKEIVLKEIRTGRTFSASITSKMIIGRNEKQCDLQLSESDCYMSGVHLLLILSGERLYAEDMNSTNGTYLNNMKMDRREEIFEGDLLKLGHSEFRILSIR